ncbi:MAG: hypothetical protein GXO89_03780 [Chlorobi bacterium]|nr:hypothetical protein [Chlorobiota bacterium]
MKKNLLILMVLVLGTTLAFNACKKTDDVPIDPVNKDATVLFTLNHNVNGEQLVFDSIQYQNASGNDYSVATLKYFVSNITFHSTNGSSFVIDGEHYVDAADPSTLNYSPNVKIPEGEYSSISFIFGLDTLKNKNGRYLNPPESNMEWPPAMGQGYHYMKLEGKIDSAGTIKNFQAHTGQSMGNPYFIEVDLPNSGFTAEGGTFEIMLKMDIGKWWETPNQIDLNFMTSMMGNQMLQQKLHENGNDVFSIEITPILTITD